MTPKPNAVVSEVLQMDPAVLIFLLYLMIIHELVSGWMEYQKQTTKPKKQWTGSSSSQASHSTVSHSLVYPVPRQQPKDWRKPGRIIRKV